MKRNASLVGEANKVLDLKAQFGAYTVNRPDGVVEALDISRIQRTLEWATIGCDVQIDIHALLSVALKNIFDGVGTTEILDALLITTTSLIETEPAYSYISARLLFRKLFIEISGTDFLSDTVDTQYRKLFVSGIQKGIQADIFDAKLLDFDIEFLATKLVPDRDQLFGYMGLQTLYGRYFAKIAKQRIELPQALWMRIAMGLAINESNKNEAAIKFYNLMSELRYIPSTPTLLHAGLIRPQLSSCFLSTVNDDLKHIFKCLADNAQMSKWSGGVANDWTPLRATGALIKKINMQTQGIIPFLKLANDVTAAISRSGSRRGATVVYLETWHLDIEDFLDLRRNTGDDRRRTHDMNTANWVPDLFIKRVLSDSNWTLFSPHETPDLHELYGQAFEKRYVEYEKMAEQGLLTLHKTIPATQLWRKMLSRLFETGHPWLTFKDPCNIRSPQDHAGVIHSSNLCTEITLNTSEQETAVCNLGSINLGLHVINGAIDQQMLQETITTAVRMLDNVIDINFYPTEEGKTSNLRHRPVGLGLMGFQDALYKSNINFSEQKALDFADSIMETISYHAILASSLLAKERGTYTSYTGSKWDRGIFPLDTVDLLEKERGVPIEVNRTSRLDWKPVRNHVRTYGMRNSNVMAIAPTATISNIAGCFPCIEPIYKNLYVKSNMMGEFTIVNKYLVHDLKKLNLWNNEMLDKIKYCDGSVQLIEEIPQILKEKYKEVFEVDPLWLVAVSAARVKWIDQSQSHNVFLKGASGKLLHDIYITGWKAGLKTFYYLRTLGATQIEKATLDAKKFGFTQKREYSMANMAQKPEQEVLTAQACNLSEDPSCESCQ